MKILVVEDDTSIRRIIRTYLESAGFDVVCTENGIDALELHTLHHPALVVLDLNLPGLDGLQVADKLRQHSDVYILMLTARSEEEDRIAGLKLGADDYLTKPFSPRELVARVEAILRRRRGENMPSSQLQFKHLTINSETYEAKANEQLLELTTTEFQVLWELATHRNQVLTREQLLNRVWGHNFYGNERVVDVYVGQVRRKLQTAVGYSLIDTIRGIGYKFTDTPNE